MCVMVCVGFCAGRPDCAGVICNEMVMLCLLWAVQGFVLGDLIIAVQFVMR